jgi:hypothetical protein
MQYTFLLAKTTNLLPKVGLNPLHNDVTPSVWKKIKIIFFRKK